MATVNLENDSVNGLGGFGGLFGGGMWGLLIVLFLLFIVFKDMFKGNNSNQDSLNGLEARLMGWATEKDVLENRYATASQIAASEARVLADAQNRELRAKEDIISGYRTDTQTAAIIAAINSNGRCTEKELYSIQSSMAKQPPVWSAAYLPDGAGYPRRSFSGHCEECFS